MKYYIALLMLYTPVFGGNVPDIEILPINHYGIRCISLENNKALIQVDRNIPMDIAPQRMNVTLRFYRPGYQVKIINFDVEI